MNIKKKIALVAVLGIAACWLVMRYGIIVMLYLTTPPVRELNRIEKAFTDSLKRICKCREIHRVPEYTLKTSKQYTNEYGLYFRGVPNVTLKNRDSLNIVSYKIAKELYNDINQRSNEFDLYVVSFESTDNRYYLEFNTKELR